MPKKSKKFKVKVTKKGNLTVKSKGKKKKGIRKKFKVEVKERGNMLTVKIKNLSLRQPGSTTRVKYGSLKRPGSTTPASGSTTQAPGSTTKV